MAVRRRALVLRIISRPGNDSEVHEQIADCLTQTTKGLKKLIPLAISASFLLYLSACGIYTQIKRDELRYRAVNRGTEKYEIKEKDSLTSAKERATKSLEDYKEHFNAYTGYYNLREERDNLKKEVEELKKGRETADKTTKPSEKIVPHQGPSTNGESKSTLKPSILDVKARFGFIGLYWPESILNHTDGGIIEKDIDKDGKYDIREKRGTLPQELTLALSSTASISQMRDLLTEPSFPDLLPTTREVNVGCLPPPDSAAFEAASKFQSYFEKEGVMKAGLSGEFATTAVKLFEESERTLFLQYALFRLCEMAVNSPSGFRNVYPVIIHDIVRRSAELKQLANKEAENRRIEEEKTKQKSIELKIKEVEASMQKEAAYFDCLKTTATTARTLTDEDASQCKKYIEKIKP